MKEEKKRRAPKIGDIYLINFSGSDHEQKGLRPGVIFQNNVGNDHSPNVIVLPLTSVIKRIELPTHVLVPKEVGLLKDSIVLCENPECISKHKLGNYILSLPEEYIGKIAIASLLASSAISYVDPDLLLVAWQRAVALNVATV